MNSITLFERALLLPDNVTLVIMLNEPNVFKGVMKLTNNVRYMTTTRLKNLKRVLMNVEPYITEFYEV